VRIPGITWQAFIAHTNDHGDLIRLADSAERRLLCGYAMRLYRRLADADDSYAADRLVELLAAQGRVDELRTRVDAGNRSAAARLARLLVEQGRIDELQAEVHAGNPTACDKLLALLTKQGQAEQLRRFGLDPDGLIAATEDVAGG
jgi:hypothetical protein